MSIGTSKGAFFDDEFHHATGEAPTTADQNEYTLEGDLNQQNDKITEAKDVMPFPDNSNPDTDFNSRFGTLPPSGILNDIRPQPDKPLTRRL